MKKDRETKKQEEQPAGQRPVLKVLLVRANNGEKEICCGPGMIRLLRAIKETGNVRRACEIMGLSYSKGWKLLKAIETWLGVPAVIRRQGGKGGGEAFLTSQGIAFMEKYLAFETACEEAVTRIFQRHYGER